MAALIEERTRRGPFRSLEDLLRRAPIDRSDARLLIRGGACDRIGLPPQDEGTETAPPAGPAFRPRLHWRLLAWEAAGRGRRGRAPELFPPDPAPPPKARPYDDAKLLRDEVETLGFLVSRHPLTLYRDAVLALRRSGEALVRGADLGRHAGRRVSAIGWLVTGKVVSTKDEQPMEFISFEDTTAIYETTFFPRAYARFCHMLTTARPYLLRGTVEEDFGAMTVTVDDVAFLDAVPAERGTRLTLVADPVVGRRRTALRAPGPDRAGGRAEEGISEEGGVALVGLDHLDG